MGGRYDDRPIKPASKKKKKKKKQKKKKKKKEMGGHQKQHALEVMLPRGAGSRVEHGVGKTKQINSQLRGKGYEHREK